MSETSSCLLLASDSQLFSLCDDYNRQVFIRFNQVKRNLYLILREKLKLCTNYKNVTIARFLLKSKPLLRDNNADKNTNPEGKLRKKKQS